MANAGVDVFEELFKLVFTKLFDEMEAGRDRSKHLEFRNYGDTETELKEKIQDIFDKAKIKWEGVFSEDSKIELTASHLSVCVSSFLKSCGRFFLSGAIITHSFVIKFCLNSDMFHKSIPLIGVGFISIPKVFFNFLLFFL